MYPDKKNTKDILFIFGLGLFLALTGSATLMYIVYEVIKKLFLL